MKILIAFFMALVFGSPGFAQTYPVNELPMYGNIPKTEAMLDADKKLIEGVLAAGVSREDGSKHAALRGWQAFQKGDLATAMRRFNNAWLLDPKNPDAFHGFAVVVAARDHKFEEAETYYRKGSAYNPSDANFFSDFARLLIIRAKYEESILQAEKALQMDPLLIAAHMHLAYASDKLGRNQPACKSGQIIQRANPRGLPPGLIEKWCGAN